MEDDTMEGSAGRQSATATPSRAQAAVHGMPCPACPPVACARPLASGVHVNSEHRGTHIAIVERVPALAGRTSGGTHKHELALVVTAAACTMPRRGGVPTMVIRIHTRTFTHIRLHTHTPARSIISIYLSKYRIYIHIHIYIYMCVRESAYMCMCMRTCMCMLVCSCACVRACVCVCVHEKMAL